MSVVSFRTFTCPVWVYTSSRSKSRIAFLFLDYKDSWFPLCGLFFLLFCLSFLVEDCWWGERFYIFCHSIGMCSNCCGSIIYSTFLSGLGTAFIQFSQEKFPLETWTFKKISPPIPIELEPPEYEHQICLSLKLPTGSWSFNLLH
jgi:hypothetical protein